SGYVRRIRANFRDLKRYATDSLWQRDVDRFLDCAAPDDTTMLSPNRAVLRQCRMHDGGWPQVAVAAAVGPLVYGMSGVPAVVPLLKDAVALLEGQKPPSAAAGREGFAAYNARLIEQVVGKSTKLVGIQQMGAFDKLMQLGLLRNQAADYAGAEAAYRRALDIQERTFGVDTMGSGNTLCQIALQLSGQRRHADAAALFARAETLVKAIPRDYGRCLTFRSYDASRLGKYPEELALAEQSLQIRRDEAAQAGNRSNRPSEGVAHSLYGVALAAKNVKDLALAERSIRESIDAFAASRGANFWWVGHARGELAQILQLQGKPEEAANQGRQMIELFDLVLGDSVRAVRGYVMYGNVLAAQGKTGAALAAYRSGAQMVLRLRLERGEFAGRDFASYLSFALATAGRDAAALADEAFAASQLPADRTTGRAVALMSARVAADDPAIGGLARAYQDATTQLAELRQSLAREGEKPADKRDAKREAELKQQLRAATEKLEGTEAQLQSAHPRYAQLTNPRPLNAAETSALLRPGEALLSMLVTQDETFVFLVREKKVRAHAVKLRAEELEGMVARLRNGLALPDGEDHPRSFDLALSHELYTKLLGPLAGGLAGVKHLLIVPSGPLASLPPAVLVSKPSAPRDYRAAAWLAKDMALTVLPSVAALRELRAVARPSQAPQAFIGFGNPRIGEDGGAARGKRGSVQALAEACREQAGVDRDLVRALPALPETADELRAIAAAVNAPADSVILGSRASEATLRATDLSRYKVLAFATHGLLPAELKCQREPALVLTPPAEGADDGLLDASEITRLKLDANLVLLSACNTAGPDGGTLGGESLSGLVRAFIYAGSRAVLASHWAIASEPTVALTTTLFRRNGEGAGWAEALRKSQLALAEQADTSHPFYWAPFVVVGEGAPAAAAAKPAQPRPAQPQPKRP
ncbi:MAG: CHAT domain-containing protein, partial [Proteobacteria bacterium]|nr:CHAT domain-containing protein [Pseudomonadota bacterium]